MMVAYDRMDVGMYRMRPWHVGRDAESGKLGKFPRTGFSKVRNTHVYLMAV